MVVRKSCFNILVSLCDYRVKMFEYFISYLTN